MRPLSRATRTLPGRAAFQKVPPSLIGPRDPGIIASLVARAENAWAYGAPDATYLREAYVKREEGNATENEAICDPNRRFVIAPERGPN
ncbi:MAG: hypothetical protein JO097_05120 [Acidobacteriaceae bacterium]|nr:hypothetical protein [Acidobacteriaceae bacterium]